MNEGKYCKHCHPNGEELQHRHEKDVYNENYTPYWGVCDGCKLLKACWHWIDWDSNSTLPIDNDFEEFKMYCIENADRIFVREEVDGKWDSYSLNEIHPMRTAYWITRWYSENRMPTVLKEIEE